MTDHPRVLDIAGLHNLRDVGGYPLTSGGRLRWGLLFRGGAPGEITETGRGQLSALGIKTLIDLREPAERMNLPSPDLGIDGVHQVPVYRDRIIIDEIENLGPMYEQIVDHCGEDLAAVVALLAEDGALPALVHCSAGKDRTGLVIGLLLSALGVDDATVAEDYGRTAENITGEYRKRLLARGVQVGIDAQRIALLAGSPPELMTDILARVERSHGTAADYLRAHGCDEHALMTLAERLTESA